MRMILLVTIFLIASCNGTIARKVICAELTRIEIKPFITRDLSLQFNRCRLKCFDINKWETVPDKLCGEKFVSGNYALEECDETIGMTKEIWAKEIRPKIIRMNEIRRTNCK